MSGVPFAATKAQLRRSGSVIVLSASILAASNTIASTYSSWLDFRFIVSAGAL